MLKVIPHKQFKKDFKRLPVKVRDQFGERILRFLNNPGDPLLKDHALSGTLSGKRAFWVTGDVRTIYRYIDKNTVLLLQIGRHNYVYR